MRKWSSPIHFVGNEKLGLSERSSDVPISFTQDQLPNFFLLVLEERGFPEGGMIQEHILCPLARQSVRNPVTFCYSSCACEQEEYPCLQKALPNLELLVYQHFLTSAIF